MSADCPEFYSNRYFPEPVSAAIAKTLVEEITPQSEFDRLKMLSNTFEKRDPGTGRPTKKERRLIEKFREL